jgi:hypothetical protein
MQRRILVWLSRETYQRLQASAALEGHSHNAEAERLLEEALNRRWERWSKLQATAPRERAVNASS